MSEQGASGPEIRDYGFLSDCSTAALVSRDGSIDWWCVPRFDSPTVFGRLLGPDAGSWSLRPTRASTTSRSYLDDTLVIRTVHTTSTGTVAVTDALALEPGARGHDVGLDSPHVLVRAVEGLAGTVAMTTELAARPEYGLTRPHLRRLDATSFEAYGGPVRLVATGPAEWDLDGDVARAAFTIEQGERVELRLGAVPAFPPHPTDAARDVADLRKGRPRRHRRGLAIVGRRPHDLRRRAPRPGAPQLRRAPRPDLRAVRRGARGRDDEPAGDRRRGRHLGLPLRLGARPVGDGPGARVRDLPRASRWPCCNG